MCNITGVALGQSSHEKMRRKQCRSDIYNDRNLRFFVSNRNSSAPLVVG